MRTLFLIVFVDLVGFGLIIPLIPFFGEFFDASPLMIGLLMASYSLAQFISAPLWGGLSDRVGRRPVLVASLAGAVAAYAWMAFAEALWMLFAARLVAGFMAGNISVAFAYAADITSPADRAKGMGLIGAAFGLGFIFGPAIGGMLAGADPHHADFQTPSLVAAGFSALALVLTLAFLREPLAEHVRKRHTATPSSGRWRQFRAALAQPAVAWIILLTFLATFVFAGMEAMFALWSRRQFGWGPEQNGYLFAFVGLISALIQGGLVGKLVRRFGEVSLLAAGAAALAAGMALIPQAATPLSLVPAMVVATAGFSLVSPVLNTLLSLNVEEVVRGGTMGVGRSAATLARVIGPAWAGLLFHSLGKDWPFYAGALVMVAMLILSLRARAILTPAAVAKSAASGPRDS